MFLFRDGILLSSAKAFNGFGMNLDATWSSFVGVSETADFDGGFVWDFSNIGKLILVKFFPIHDALDDAGAVSQ